MTTKINLSKSDLIHALSIGYIGAHRGHDYLLTVNKLGYFEVLDSEARSRKQPLMPVYDVAKWIALEKEDYRLLVQHKDWELVLQEPVKDALKTLHGGAVYTRWVV